jgi:hypothetical protein
MIPIHRMVLTDVRLHFGRAASLDVDILACRVMEDPGEGVGRHKSQQVDHELAGSRI